MGTLSKVAIIVPILLLLVGLEYFLSKRKKMQVYSFSDTVVNMCCGMLERLTDFFFVVVFYFVLEFVEGLSPFAIPSNALTFLLVFLLGDMMAYWHHRLSHEINVMWATHIVHHQSEELNITTVFRVSGLAVFFRAIFWFWIPFLGFSSELTLTAMVFIGLYQFVSHTRLINKMGFLEYILITPSHHRVHHARNDQYLDKNYGHVFVFWDKMFGTFEPEVEEPEFGIVAGFENSNPYWAYFSYWVDLYQRSKVIPGFFNKIKLWLMPPGWMPEGVDFKKELSFETDEKGHRKKYINSIPFRLQLYIGLHLAPMFYGFVRVVSKGRTLDAAEVGLLISLLLFSVFSLGMLLERKTWAWKVELFRLACIIISLPLLFWPYSYTLIWSTLGIVLSFIFAFWLLRMRDYLGVKAPDRAVFG